MKVIEEFENNNKILNYKPNVINSKINFKGKNNILICEENVILKDSYISFEGSNSIIYLSSNDNYYFLNITTNNNSVLFIDENCYFNSQLYIILSESKNVFIGKNCLFSIGIWMRLADPHLIYDVDNMRRINVSKSIYIGDHVWIGQDVMLLKGTQIGSGSIIGAKSLVSNKKIHSNSIWGGNPAKKIRNNIFFDSETAHNYKNEETEKSMMYVDRKWIYEHDKETLGFEYLGMIKDKKTMNDKIEFLIEIRNNKSHNRFHVKEIKNKKKRWKIINRLFF